MYCEATVRIPISLKIKLKKVGCTKPFYDVIKNTALTSVKPEKYISLLSSGTVVKFYMNECVSR